MRAEARGIKDGLTERGSKLRQFRESAEQLGGEGGTFYE